MLGCSTCDAIIDLSTLDNLQKQVDKSLAKNINNKYHSQRNDLDCKFPEEKVKALINYYNILTKIENCSDCFQDCDYELDEILSLIQNEING